MIQKSNTPEGTGPYKEGPSGFTLTGKEHLISNEIFVKMQESSYKKSKAGTVDNVRYYLDAYSEDWESSYGVKIDMEKGEAFYTENFTGKFILNKKDAIPFFVGVEGFDGWNKIIERQEIFLKSTGRGR